MKKEQLIKLSEVFEQYLGDPTNGNSVVNFNSILKNDELEQLDEAQLQYIKAWGYMDYLIPQALGGKLSSLEFLLFLGRICGRRDLTSAVALGLTFLGSLPVWIAADKNLQQRHAQKLKAGKITAFALTERQTGGDIASSTMSAEYLESNWILNGEKWCINYANLGDIATALCRTHPQGGALGFSVFYIDKALNQSGFKPIARLPTHGVRGLDISGFQLEDYKTAPQNMIGSKGQGLALTYKTLQISRLLCASLVLGGTDTALRQAIQFSLERKIYNERAFDLAVVRQRLAECFCYQMIQDSVALTVMRAATISPKGLNIWSAILKYFAPKVSEDIIEQCGLIIGARGYLRTEQYAMFQKIRRDVQVVGLFDGSSQVNLYLLATNLYSQALKRQSNKDYDEGLAKKIFDLNEVASPFDAKKIYLLSQQMDCIIKQLSQIKSAPLQAMIDKVILLLNNFDKEIIQINKQNKYDPKSFYAFRMAEKYCWIFAACCTIQLWYYSTAHLAKPLQNQDWLQLACQLILAKANGEMPKIEDALYENVAKAMLSFYDDKKLFSVLDIKTCAS